MNIFLKIPKPKMVAARLKPLSRTIKLISTVSIWILFLFHVDWISGSPVFRRIFLTDPLSSEAAARGWSAMVYAMIFVAGLPAALLLWHWRDQNVQKQIDNSKRDINIKELHEIQLRSAGIIENCEDENVKYQLQISSLHQMRKFLSENSEEYFRDSTLEFILSAHRIMALKYGVDEIFSDLSGHTPLERWKKESIGTKIYALIKQYRERLNIFDESILNILSNEWDNILGSGIRLIDRHFDLIDLSFRSFPERIDLRRSSLRGAILNGSSLVKAHLYGAQMEGIRLIGANINEANFANSKLMGASLHQSYAENATFSGTDVSGTGFQNANLFGSNFIGSTLYNVDFFGSNMDNTVFINSDCRGSSFKSASLRNSIFRNVDFRDTDLSNADFRGAMLFNCRIDLNTVANGAWYDESTSFSEVPEDLEEPLVPADVDLKDQRHEIGFVMWEKPNRGAKPANDRSRPH